MYHHSYLRSAIDIVEHYQGEEPFAVFLKKYFSNNRKFGSRDRKQVSHLCYCYFRTGKLATGPAAEDRILAGLFLCSTDPHPLVTTLRPQWTGKEKLSIEEKLAAIGHSIAEVFPWHEALSTGIDASLFASSFFIQPDLFLRIRPGMATVVHQQLSGAGLSFQPVSDECIALPNGSKLDAVIKLDQEAVVQDYNSQQTINLMLSQFTPSKSRTKVWDCCAASGGKSIMLHDHIPNIDLTVSDIRESILHNLRKRFATAGINHFYSFVKDLSSSTGAIPNSPFDLIVADVPCSGSGTWSRTPEQLFFFDEKKIDHYSTLQKHITGNVIPYLKTGGYLLYSTCSVFKKENEEVVDYIKENFHLDVLRMEVLKGYQQKADTMFAAILQKSL